MLKVEETGEVIPSVVLSPSELACVLRVLSNGTVDRGDEAEIVAASVADGLISEGRPTELALGIFGGLGEGRRQVQVLSVNAHETVSVRAFLSPATTTMIVGSEDRLRVTALDPAEPSTNWRRQWRCSPIWLALNVRCRCPRISFPWRRTARPRGLEAFCRWRFGMTQN